MRLTNSLYRWYIPVNVVMGTISGSLIGLVVASIVRPPYPYFKFTIIHIGIGRLLLFYYDVEPIYSHLHFSCPLVFIAVKLNIVLPVAVCVCVQMDLSPNSSNSNTTL